MKLSDRLLQDHNAGYGVFGQTLKYYSDRAKQLEDIVEAAAHIGVDFGYGPYELDQEHIDNARKLLAPELTNNSDGE